MPAAVMTDGGRGEVRQTERKENRESINETKVIDAKIASNWCT